MATATGKVMRRKIGGTRFTLKKRKRHVKHGSKVFHNAALTPEQYRAAKRTDRDSKKRKAA